MPKALVSFVRNVDTMSTWLGKVLGFGVLVIIAILLIETVCRYALEIPTVWAVELSEFTFGTYFIVGGAYVLLRGAHVRLDILSSRWSPRTRAIVDLATFSLVAIYLITFIKGGIFTALYSIGWNHHSKTMWGPPLAPIKVIMIVGASLLLLQAVAILIRDIGIIKGREIES